jgi:S-adenosylmethionine hydrolase
MPILTCTTDYGLKDPYAAMLRGRLLTRFPGWRIEDISHNISEFDLLEAIYVVKTAYGFFPPGTLHLVDVGFVPDLGQNTVPAYCVTRMDGHWFVLPDKEGLITQLSQTIGQTLQRYPLTVPQPLPGFQILNWLDGPVGMLIQALESNPGLSIAPEPWAAPVQDQSVSWIEQPSVINGVLTGKVVYADHYGNLHTNIARSALDQFAEGKTIQIHLKRILAHENKVEKIHSHYHAVTRNDLVLLYNAGGFLQVAMAHDHAYNLLGLRVNDKVMIERIG